MQTQTTHNDADELPLAALDPDLLAVAQRIQADRLAAKQAADAIELKRTAAIAAGFSPEAVEELLTSDRATEGVRVQLAAKEIADATSRIENAKHAARIAAERSAFEAERRRHVDALHTSLSDALAAWSSLSTLKSERRTFAVGEEGAHRALTEALRTIRRSGKVHDPEWLDRLAQAVTEARANG